MGGGVALFFEAGKCDIHFRGSLITECRFFEYLTTSAKVSRFPSSMCLDYLGYWLLEKLSGVISQALAGTEVVHVMEVAAG